VYVDPKLDIAIIKIKSSDIPNNAQQADLACDFKFKPGQNVGVFGHPWGFNFTATRGIISSLTYLDGEQLIQTDASIRQGNSGGPMLSLSDGRVVGVATAILSDNDGRNGVGFATPMHSVCKILNLIHAKKDPSPPQIPISFFEDKDENTPLKIAEIHGSGFENLQVNDEILHVVGSDEKTTHKSTLIEILRGHYGQTVEVEILRNGKKRRVSIHPKPMFEVLGRFGMTIAGLTLSTTNIMKEDHLEQVLKVTRIEDGSLATLTQLEVGDVLDTVDGGSYGFIAILYQHVSQQKQSGKKTVHMIFNRPHLNGIFSWFEYDIPIRKVAPIGHIEFAERGNENIQ